MRLYSTQRERIELSMATRRVLYALLLSYSRRQKFSACAANLAALNRAHKAAVAVAVGVRCMCDL